MAVYFPSYQPTQIVGLPPLSDDTYIKIADSMKVIYAEYKQAAQPRGKE